MTIIYLIRHGETDWNAMERIQGQTDIPLNETGKRQAAASASHLKTADWDVMITSPLARTKETAEIINAELNLPLYEMENFVERGFGQAEGMTLADRAAIFPDRIYPGQEEWADLTRRVLDGLAEIRQNFPDRNVLLVSHGGVINALLSELSNGEIGSGKTKLTNASISHIHFQEEQWLIRDFNRTDHLLSVEPQ
ncbi:histidine phosphatase family protein [Planococcus lenghuensis]|uniref:Histidine phosphatase family protein n=1 Tax=Planococcus lenghuensis TaxID=2213202 RepID=A0A1Q2L0C1_9BACL|nr:histidine phosphatase family protein [Planococcus lenghuensis]AQQ53342.1 histidine phosphatase family protein [Planococcus lenghuensis]